MFTRLRGDEGANAVEFALLLPVLLVLLFGTMYGSALYNSQQTLNQAAREGARFAATLPITGFGHTTAPPPDSSAWFTEVHDRVEGILDLDRPLASDPPRVCVRFYADDGVTTSQVSRPASSCPPVSAAGPLQGARVEVTVVRPSRLELGISSLGPIDLTSQGVARHEEILD